MLKSICVFCGARTGLDPVYSEAAEQLGRLIAEKNLSLVYGGGRIGIMGIVADSVLAHGGEVTGIIPHFLAAKEVAHGGLSELVLVDTMHERKMIMHERSDAIIALPGGFGTMEELCEVLTWGQLGLHEKPIGLLNVNGFYNHLAKLFDHMVSEGFLSLENRRLILIEPDAETLLARMAAYAAPTARPQILDERHT